MVYPVDKRRVHFIISTPGFDISVPAARVLKLVALWLAQMFPGVAVIGVVVGGLTGCANWHCRAVNKLRVLDRNTSNLKPRGTSNYFVPILVLINALKVNWRPLGESNIDATLLI